MINQLREKIYPHIYRKYNIDGFKLDLGRNHKLPLLKYLYPMYDCFLPVLAELEQDASKIVLDVGANVGDTLASMIKHTNAKFVCVEPTQYFYSLLKHNVEQMGEEYQKRVKTVNAYISSDTNKKYQSVISRGSAVMESTEHDKGIDTRTIESIVYELKVNPQDIFLIKTDTDGYDAECIMTIGSRILINYPILLYWENQIDDKFQYSKFLEMVDFLNQCGYSDFFIFDAYGNYLVHIENQMAMKELESYLLRIAEKKSANGVRYFDILSCKSDQAEMCRKAIEMYTERII